MDDLSTDALSGIPEKLLLGKLLTLMRPPERLSSREWAEAKRVLTSEVTAKPGKYNLLVTPYMIHPLACVDNPDIRVIIAKKSAQIAWTETINNAIGRRIDVDPCPIIIAFPTLAMSTAYVKEKFKPFVKSTPELLEKIGDPDKSSWSMYSYPGGFIKFITAGSPSALKSTSAPFLIVEEPDDLKEDLKDQGDALDIFKERQKSFPDRTLVFGGTPTDKGFSRVDTAYERSCQYVFLVPCHKCGKDHVLDFDNLKCDEYPNNHLDPNYGNRDPLTARYECPHCKAVWTDEQKNLNVLEAIKYHDAGWKKLHPDKAEIGFAFNELMSPFPGSYFVDLAKKWLAAEVDLVHGKEGKMIAFTNNSKGEAYEPTSSTVTVHDLKSRALDYPELTVPEEGLVLTAGVDVQHNRFAIIIRARGANQNSWLVYHTEIFGDVLNPRNAVWDRLANVFKMRFPWAGKQNVTLGISAASIDTGDGTTAELVYNFIKNMNQAGYRIMATKGDSEVSGVKEIFNVPTNKLSTKEQTSKSLAENMGVAVYIVGTTKGKDTVLRKLHQTDTVDRMYNYATVSDDYYKQLLSNSKRVSGVNKRVRYMLKSGHNDEALDCEVLALHASRSLYLHLRTNEDWMLQKAQLLGLTKNIPEETSVNVTPGLNIRTRDGS